MPAHSAQRAAYRQLIACDRCASAQETPNFAVFRKAAHIPRLAFCFSRPARAPRSAGEGGSGPALSLCQIRNSWCTKGVAPGWVA